MNMNKEMFCKFMLAEYGSGFHVNEHSKDENPNHDVSLITYDFPRNAPYRVVRITGSSGIFEVSVPGGKLRGDVIPTITFDDEEFAYKFLYQLFIFPNTIHLNDLIESKSEIPVEKNPDPKEQSPISFKLGISTFFLTLAFIVLKLTGRITWSWIWVLSPVWIAMLLLAIILVISRKAPKP